MSNIDFKKKAIAVGVVIGMLSGAGVMTASANTNIFTGSSTTSASADKTPTSTKTTVKVEDVQANRAGANSPKAKETVNANETRTVSSAGHAQAPEAAAKETNDVESKAKACVAAEHAQKVQIERIKAIEAGPSRVEAMENIEENESTKGCLSSSQEILDLTLALPTIRGSWGDIGTIVRNRLDKEINQIKENTINRACEIADKAIVDATAPVVDFYNQWNSAVEIINGADALVGKYLADKVTVETDKVAMYLDERLNSAQAKLDARNQKFAEAYQGIKDSANQKVYDVVGFDIDDAQSSVLNIRKQQTQEAIEVLQKQIPPKPTETVRMSGGEYLKCVGAQCTPTTISEYQKISAQHKAHADAVAEHGTKINMLQKQLNELNNPTEKQTAESTESKPRTLGAFINNALNKNGQEQQVAQAPATTTAPTTTTTTQETPKKTAEQKVNEAAENELSTFRSTKNVGDTIGTFFNRFRSGGETNGSETSQSNNRFTN